MRLFSLLTLFDEAMDGTFDDPLLDELLPPQLADDPWPIDEDVCAAG